MITMNQQDTVSRRMLGYFLVFYFLLWGVTSSIFYKSIYADTAENLTLSHVLTWSYSKHPPLGMLVIRVFNMIFHNNEVTTYLAGATCLVLSLYFIYKICLLFLATTEAACATMLASLSYYFLANFVLQYNQNTIMLPFWVASIYYFIKAIRHNKLRYWILLSATCFLGVMAKYESFIIIGLEFLYLTLHFNKKYWRGLLVASFMFAALLVPHIIWLWHTNFPPIQYAITTSTAHANHLKVFLSALIMQPLNYALAFIVLLFVMRRSSKPVQLKPNFASPLIFLALTPWLLFCLLAIFMQQRAEWGFPILVLFIPALFYHFKIKCNQINSVMLVVVVLQLIIFVVFILAKSNSTATHRSEWPSYALASAAQNYWVKQNHTLDNLKYIAGDEPIVFYLGAYLPQKPLMLKEYNFQKSPWIQQADWDKNGALFIEQGCTHSSAKYNNMGFKVINHKCFSVTQTHTLKPEKLNFTLYLIASKPLKKTGAFL